VTVSHRSTTSSRRPGASIEGSVSFQSARLVQCRECPTQMLDYVLPGQHGAHFNAKGVLVNCAGVPL
jgi:hypothetical protein